MSNMELSAHLFLQIAFILVVCRLVGTIARKLGQPQVVGEMIAGIVMGPTLFGWLFPTAQAWVFPHESMHILYALSQLGLVLYMFGVGLEFDIEFIQHRFRKALSISLVGILAPLSMASLLVWQLDDRTLFFPAEVTLVSAMLFMGAAMAVTAFPVLSRILQERLLTGTPLGVLVLAAGAIDDVVAWCLLAMMLAMFGGTASTALLAIGGGSAYTIIVLAAGRPLLRRLEPQFNATGRISGSLLSLVLTLLLLSAWFTDLIGIHAVFGSFILGIAMPRRGFAQELRRMVEPLTLNTLLPLFFIYSGLNTRLGLVDTPLLWALTLGIILSACLSKGVACWLAARVGGASAADSVGIGILMNARGLMELVLLNIGLARHIITPTLFSMMVLMAVVTTLITLPLFTLVSGRRPWRGAAQPANADRPMPELPPVGHVNQA